MSNVNKSGPNRIKPLDPQLVNRIAAGEIIQRPFNALKELIENSLDAGSTSINIQIKDGGLKLIQIQDNGCGIEKEDLKIICERFTTSKLKEFDDLKTINTFGFRGEALASISHVSRLTIITRTVNSPCAFKATYTDAKLTSDGIKPCASASKGTQITVEDLFYNSSIRRNALKTGSDEFSKIYEVVSRYAIHNYHVGFYLKRIGENSNDLKTIGCISQTNKEKCLENESFLLDNIGTVYGHELKNELERLSIDYDENFKFNMIAYMSNSKYVALKQMIFILFINDRLVDCQPIKKILQNLFSLYMPKNTSPFIYMNLQMNSNNIDVNIHPTKHEIRFLYQDEIINKIQKCFEDKLLNSNVSRTHYVKNLTLDIYMNKKTDQTNSQTEAKKEGETLIQAEKVYPYQLTRVDSKERKLDSYLHSTSLNESIKSFRNNSKAIAEDEYVITSAKHSESTKSVLRNKKLPRNLNYVSLIELRDNIEKNTSKHLKNIIQDMCFVGCLDSELALIQHQTGLYILNTNLLCQDLFYQITIFNFGNFGYLKLEKPIKIFDLAFMALNDPVKKL
jgi:DNA mismatch repair protein MLH1